MGKWLATTRASRIGRARRDTDGAQALLKVSTADPAVFRDEYALLRSLDVPGVLHPQELTAFGAAPAMWLPDRDVVGLADALQGPPLGVGTALRIGCALARGIRGLHAAGVRHGDLRPANVLVEPASGAAWIADLSAAVERRRAGAADAVAPSRDAIEPIDRIDRIDDWAWVAPEQTGRMNRPVDERADFYSLGLLLYRLLTGRAPFEAADALEWAHCHAARVPPSPTAVAPEVPAVVSDLVMKLLAKTAEGRYRHADGLLADLQHCLERWEVRGAVEPFPLTAEDAAGDFEVPDRLYGRQREEATLREAYAQVAASDRPRLLLVTGAPGIGKTALVHRLKDAVVAGPAHFVEAKFDSQRRDVPYATLLQALQDLVRQALAAPDAQVATWRAALAEALGPNGQLIVDVVPALASLVGPQPPLADVAPAEATNRLRWVLGRFVGVFARSCHPLAIFLDDLQWADTASLAMLGDLLVGDRVGALLVVGAYRDQEVDAAHPLTAMLQDVATRGARIDRLPLAPLTPADAAFLVADVLASSPQQVESLAALIAERTEGNPFFILQFLAELRDEGLLSPAGAADPGRAGGAGRAWRWDLERIRARQRTDDVVGLVGRRLRRLPRAARDVLRQAACLGASGSETMLATATDRPIADVAAAMAQAADAGLVERRDGGYRFAHDRVQEAAYALIPNRRRADAHLRVGRLLLASLAPADLDERIYDVVRHLNHGAERITDEAERWQVARLNAAAGRKAKAALAFAAAHGHLARAAAAWPATGWEACRDETFALQFDLAECALLVGHFAEADARLDALLARARDRAEQARLYGVRIRRHLVPGEFGAAAHAALRALELFDIRFPDGDAVTLLAGARAEVERELRGRSVAELLQAPPLTDSVAQTVLGLIVDAFTAIYIAQPAIFPRLVLEATRLALRHGNGGDSAVVYTYYARVLLASFGEIEPAYEFSQLALRLNEKLDDRRRRGMLLFSHAGFIHFWRRPFASGRPILDRGFAACLEVGNFVHAALIAVNTCLYLAEGGERLQELAAQVERATEFLRATHSGGTLEVVQVFGQFARCLQGRTRGPATFDDDAYDHAAVVRRMVAQNNLAGLGIVHMLQQVAACIGGDASASLQAAARTQEVLPAVFAMAVRPTFVFYRALALAASDAAPSAAARAAHLEDIAQAAAQLQAWAAHCPENYATRHRLVAAEHARLTGDELRAERLYEQAIAAARDAGLVHQEALACERAAEFHRARGLPRIADACLADAREAYARWGAVGKVRLLESRFPALQGARTAGAFGSARAGGPDIDTLAVVKATRALSSQIELDALLDTLMRIALAEAGAQAGRLYVVDAERMQLAARAEVSGGAIDVRVVAAGAAGGTGHVTAEEAARATPGDHPEAVLNYVRRTREPVLLDDAAQSHAFAGDAYLAARRPRSVLCLPLLRKSETIGILYLEHLAGTHAFTPQHAAVLEMLAGQAAISLETARLYAALKEENAQRQRAEAATREWRARIERLVDSNLIAVRIAGRDGRIVDANEAFLRLVGYTREDMVAGRLTRLAVTAPEFRAADERAIAQLLRDGRFTPYEKEYVRKDGTRVPVLTGGISLQADPPLSLGFVVDLSERRRSDEERRARLEAEAASRAKSAFLATMSHELRTPLNAIIGMSELALRSGLSARQADHITKVHGAARSLMLLINDLLDFSKIEAGQLAIEAIAFELGAVMDDLANLVRLKAEEKGLELVFAVGADLPRRLVGDPHRLGQVLLNLCNNALKFTERGEVVVSVREVGREADATTLQFEVRDTGIGIDADAQRRLFQPFTQAESSTGRRYGGTGLGLAICRRLVELMGGDIGLESETGRGSTFHFRLRFGLAAGAGRTSLQALRGARALVVDDNAATRDALSEMARSLGLRADAVGGGREAIDAVLAADAADEPYALVLLDYLMPGMDGLSCARRLRGAPLRHAAPIVMLVSALDRDVLQQRLADERLAVAATLIKPVTPSALIDACAVAMGGALPPAPPDERHERVRTADVRRVAGARVLVVEDHPINQEIAVGLLEPAGVDVRIANDGREALEILDREAFDAVLMDCQMPVMDGYEAARRIRVDGRHRDLPLIAMTADAMLGDRERALAAGMNDHLPKPIDVEELFRKLARWIQRPQPGDDAGGDLGARLARERAQALSRMGGNLALYERTVAMFRDFRASFCESFRQAHESGDRDAARRLAHDLKSVAAMVGTATVRRAAEGLEQACAEDAGAVEAAFEDLRRALRQFDDEEPAGAN
ncbi:MAG TPA: response regulator [Burkholderiaceae bacterium]|nr:response regulator [Burkholderiaceae bacterium]